uniref:Uncharacterized protein n=1 Tax=Eutreptiella gymnastica TaxID=73025 RepID=A0A7S1NFY2_9EUGL|mmetsp:Transcript_25129/g.45470  ORF Transcript_25129/g.45470 Transcript_25129/m.45470 type:complete len:136 (+) Transcript_25129:49-456(+)
MDSQSNQPMPIDAGQGQNQVSMEPTLAAWRKWLEGPFQTMLQSTQLQQQLQEWGVAMEEDLTDQGIPSGAIQALNARTGGIANNMDLKESYMALGTYNAKDYNQTSLKADSSKLQLQNQLTNHYKTGSNGLKVHT